MPPPPTHRASRAPRRGLSTPGWLVLFVVALGLLAVPLLDVPADAEEARSDLDTAARALQGGDISAARKAVSAAREHVDAARDDTEGLSGDVWAAIPFLGTPVADARGLVRVLADATAVAEIGVDLYPKVAGEDATLFENGQVDGATLREVVDGARRAGEHLRSATHELRGIEASTPVLGEQIGNKRDEALAQVEPLVETFEELEPFVEELEPLLGFERPRSYLIALLNPAELRFSGGAALAFAPLAMNEGTVDVGDAITVRGDLSLQLLATWEGVPGNELHPTNARVTNATFAPSWSVAAEELLRGWKVHHEEEHYDGVIAIDVVAISALLGAAGGIDVPGYGKITQDNLVETLIGSYDRYYPDPDAQDDLNGRLIPAFRDAMFDGGDYATKVRVLAEAAAGRHFAVYFRDDGLQQGISALGLDGDLTEPTGDYLGVFTQNLNGSKVDYWQRRRVSLDVRLARDGSTENQVEVTVDNDTPVFPFPIPDPGTGYFTRFADLRVGAFLPDGARASKSFARGEPWSPELGEFYDHSFVTRRMSLDPATEGRLTLRYEVPRAALAEADTLTYHLAVDPQGTVNPDELEVTVHLPRGHRPTTLPEGWVRKGRGTLRYTTEALEASQEWQIPLRVPS